MTKECEMKNPICFAADFPNLGEAANFIKEHRLYHHIGAVKVGLEMFIASGPRSVQLFNNDFGIPVVLDLKLHDIPETVARAVKVGGDLGAKYMTMHVQQRAAIEGALKAAEPFGITLLGVTVLTSMTDRDIEDLHMRTTVHGEPHEQPGIRAEALAKFGYNAGLRGFVCSPQEVGQIKRDLPDAFFLVPGIRPQGSDQGDQKRVGTPAQTMKDGASLMAIGRPIRDAANPEEAAKAILAEIS